MQKITLGKYLIKIRNREQLKHTSLLIFSCEFEDIITFNLGMNGNHQIIFALQTGIVKSLDNNHADENKRACDNWHSTISMSNEDTVKEHLLGVLYDVFVLCPVLWTWVFST